MEILKKSWNFKIPFFSPGKIQEIQQIHWTLWKSHEICHEMLLYVGIMELIILFLLHSSTSNDNVYEYCCLITS